MMQHVNLFVFDLVILRLTKKRDRHHKRVSVSFFVLRTKPNPLAHVVKCRFAEAIFAQGVRIPRREALEVLR